MEKKVIDHELLKEIFTSLINQCDSWSCLGWKKEPTITTCSRCKTANKLYKEFPDLLIDIPKEDFKEKNFRLEVQSYISSWMLAWKKDRCKYVMFKHEKYSSLFPILFPSSLDHQELANLFIKTHPGMKAVSSGFVSIANTIDFETSLKIFNCFGESRYNNLKSKDDDNKTISLMLFHQDLMNEIE
jgi:hypothetical protein